MNSSPTARQYQFVVIGNPVVDALGHVPPATIAKFHLRLNDSNTLSHAQMMELSQTLTLEQFRAGGSAANTAYTLAKLGCKVAFMGRIGDDPTGRFFAQEMVAAGATILPPSPAVRTTEVFVLITPDGNRTMVQSVPAAPSPDDSWIDETIIEQSQYLIIGAYAAGSHPAAVDFAAKTAAQFGTQIVISLAAPRAVQAALPLLTDLILTHRPLVIGNTKEWEVLESGNDPHTVTRLAATPRVITRSGEGACYYPANGGPVVDLATQRIVNPTDVSGAGDAFAAGFLKTFTGGGSAQLALAHGHQLGRAVVLQLGPRLTNFGADDANLSSN